jgi:hypothetical protein
MAAENIQNRVNDKFPNLETMVARSLWPTPDASISRDTPFKHQKAKVEKAQKGERNSQIGSSLAWDKRIIIEAEQPQNMERGGSLNPTWVEWLMGYPEGWTDLKD